MIADRALGAGPRRRFATWSLALLLPEGRQGPRSRGVSKPLAVALTVALASLSSCGAESSETTDTTAHDPASVTHSGDPGSPSVRIVRATPRGEHLSTRQRLSRHGESTDVQQLPDGRQRLDLGGRLHQASVARITPDGRLQRGCVDSPGALDAWLEHATDESPHPGGTP